MEAMIRVKPAELWKGQNIATTGMLRPSTQNRDTCITDDVTDLKEHVFEVHRHHPVVPPNGLTDRSASLYLECRLANEPVEEQQVEHRTAPPIWLRETAMKDGWFLGT